MKDGLPLQREEKINIYLNVLEILSKSTDAYLFLWDIQTGRCWFFENIDPHYPIHDGGKIVNTLDDVVNIVYPADRQMLSDDLGEIAEGKKDRHDLYYRWVNRQGEAVWISCRGRAVYDENGSPFVMIGRVNDTALKYLYNPLTKLFNKTKLLLDLKDELLPRNSGCLMLIDIDNLRDINIKYGREKGNEVIIQCAKVLENSFDSKKIYHVENDCFAVYLDINKRDEVCKVYEDIKGAMANKCTLSSGVVPVSREMFGDEYTLIDYAQQTLLKAKNEKNSIVFLSHEDMESRIQVAKFLGELKESVDNDCEGFYLCYQPQVKTGNYDLYAAEALLRYRSKTRGNVFPDQFIPLLEQSRLINDVGLWVLKTALLQCKKWRESIEGLRISVNVSVIQLEMDNFADRVLEILSETGMPGTALTLEITESIQLQQISGFAQIFRRLREAGIELSIDDFGTGYSSMSYLKQLNVSEIKIDKMFVRGIEEATYNYRLISNMIEFAKNNSIRICCEGVESMQELISLEGLSPNLIQGYLFDKPLTAADFEHTYISSSSSEYQEKKNFIHGIYEDKGRMDVIYFDTKDILRKTDMGLWIIRINEEENHHEFHADETMERIMMVDKKYTPQECFNHWYSRIKDGYQDYVNRNVDRMIHSDKIVSLQYPWIHPTLGEVMVRCSGRRVEDSDGMITLEGCHRIISDIEETVAE